MRMDSTPKEVSWEKLIVETYATAPIKGDDADEQEAF